MKDYNDEEWVSITLIIAALAVCFGLCVGCSPSRMKAPGNAGQPDDQPTESHEEPSVVLHVYPGQLYDLLIVELKGQK